ncbi:MAG TPA: hypothetical protein VIP46_02815 [Pyrinomonadaceae bacterium]
MDELTATLKGTGFSRSPWLEIGIDLLREGKLGEAREILEEEVARAEGASRLEAILYLTKVEYAAGRYGRMLALLEDYRPLFIAAGDHGLLAWFHMSRAAARERTPAADGSHIDRAFLDYEQAIDHQLKTGDRQEAGGALNNMALMLHAAGRTAEAHEYVERARGYFRDLPIRLAQADASEAEMFHAEGDRRESRRLALRAAAAFAEHGKERLLNDLRPLLLWTLADHEGDTAR